MRTEMEKCNIDGKVDLDICVKWTEFNAFTVDHGRTY